MLFTLVLFNSLQLILALYQFVIISFLLHKRFVIADFGYHPRFQYDYLVGFSYCAQAVGNHNHRAVLKNVVQRLHYFLLVDRIQRIGRFIEKQIIGFFIQGAGDKQALPLSPIMAVTFPSGITKKRLFNTKGA